MQTTIPAIINIENLRETVFLASDLFLKEGIKVESSTERSKNEETKDFQVNNDESGINRLFAYCKGGSFNIHIWAWFGYFILLRKGNQVLVIIW